MTSFVGPGTEIFDENGEPVDYSQFMSYVKSNGKDTILFNSASKDVGGVIDIQGDDDAVVYTSQESQVDVISTGDGDDRINSGGKSDEIFAGAGNDIVRGAGGDDVIRGGKGADVLIGGEGTDTFMIKGDGGAFGPNSDLTRDAAGNVPVDAILDLNSAELDHLVLQDIALPGGQSVDYDPSTGNVNLISTATGDSITIANIGEGRDDVQIIDQNGGNYTLF